MINAPIMHVNGDYPEGRLLFNNDDRTLTLLGVDVTRAVKIAFEYRRRFKKVHRVRALEHAARTHPYPHRISCWISWFIADGILRPVISLSCD
jgi:hypothetical protein